MTGKDSSDAGRSVDDVDVLRQIEFHLGNSSILVRHSLVRGFLRCAIPAAAALKNNERMVTLFLLGGQNRRELRALLRRKYLAIRAIDVKNHVQGVYRSMSVRASDYNSILSVSDRQK